MTLTIIHYLVEWARALFGPGTGRRRAAEAHLPVAEVRHVHRRAVVRPWDPPYLPAALRKRDAGRIDGDAVAMVRPYLVAQEQEERRAALVLALDGIDVGPWAVHGVEVAR
ncbi:hypothetical protein [Streptomyces gobiensis]|uniref:hypothetical protein n=1 Tax=Streptomyces gobiensis TaxID=2875706 RepID=UPI001E2B0990|nr:hypothetical protein [Streptomyces gobiensis]UGY91552.1 hypothetical protein test1122_07315 [Streptomyces gobiensis]